MPLAFFPKYSLRMRLPLRAFSTVNPKTDKMKPLNLDLKPEEERIKEVVEEADMVSEEYKPEEVNVDESEQTAAVVVPNNVSIR